MRNQNQGPRVRGLTFVTGILVLALSAVTHGQDFRTVDGSGNSLTSPLMGSAGMPLMREVGSDYADGISAPAGATRPSARVISNTLCAQTGSMPNSAGASDFLWQWGQFLDHDIDLSVTLGSDPIDQLPISVPLGDPHFDPFSTGTQQIPFTRSAFAPGSVPRDQVNSISAWIDASNVYGSDTGRALALRTLDGTGRLRTSAGNLLPFNDLGFPNAQINGLDPALFFLAGDIRANEQIGLTAMHTLFLREHNRLATEIAQTFPSLSGDEIYLRARRLVGAQMQRITFAEFLPVLLGPGSIPPYTGYDDSVDGSIRNIFSTACYRLGHSMLSPTLLRMSPGGFEIPAGHIPLAASFFAPDAIVQDGGIEPLLRGLASQRAQEIDLSIIDSVRNFLFGPPGAGGFDLASLNIQRGRDHGLPDYNTTRVALGLAPAANFADVTSDTAAQSALQNLYGSVGNVDLWVGGLAEDHFPGAMVGELLHTVLVLQFTALRDGDRMWYENDLSPAELAEIESTTLSDIIVRNTSIGLLQEDVFRVSTPDFLRGDCDNTPGLTLSDSIHLLLFLFAGGDEIACANACDVDADGSLNLSDAIYSLLYMFSGGPAPAGPFPDCAPTAQTTDELPCYSEQNCP